MRIISVLNASRPGVVGSHVEVADTSMRRLLGLLGRRSLDRGEGLWIKPSSGVHTMGMQFPIDVIGLDKNFTVIRLWRNLVPYRMTSVSWSMCSVLELPSGRIAESGVQIGDSLRMVSS
jgi:uncharacterized membrane protein (UPF0127 family)